MTDLLNSSYERRERHPRPNGWSGCALTSASPRVRSTEVPRAVESRSPACDEHPQPRDRELRAEEPDEVSPRGRALDPRVADALGEFGIWHEQAFGPKPPDGEYVLSHIFQLDLVKMMQAPADERTHYISLDDFGQDNLRLMLHCIEKSKALQAWQLRRFEEEMLASRREGISRAV
jgi:hypothetical protein